MRSLLTVHGIAWGRPNADYASTFFDLVAAAAPRAVFERVPMCWLGARFGPLTLPLMQGLPSFRRRQERALDARVAAVGLTTPPIDTWITCGTNRILFGYGDWIFADPPPSRIAAWMARVTAKLSMERSFPSVPWINVYRDGDPWGAPLEPLVGALVTDVKLPPTSGLTIRDHSYWTDPVFARLVAEVMIKTPGITLVAHSEGTELTRGWLTR